MQYVSDGMQIDSRQVDQALTALAGRVSNMSPLMADVAMLLETKTQQAFDDEGPDWEKLSAVTTLLRSKRGMAKEAKILTESGALRQSVYSDSSSHTATVGAGSGPSAAYALMHQFGGTTSSKSMIPNKTIPARPYMPLVGSSNDVRLTDEAHDQIMEMVQDFMRP